MTEFEIKHGLSQDEPGPLAPVEIAQQPGAAPATGNTARDQEMYAAGIRTGEENAKHNAAIRAGAGWLPIESAPKDSFIFDGLHHYGTKIIVFDGSINTARWWRIEGDSASNFIDEGGRAIYPTHWMPLPAAPGVSTVEDAQAVAWMDPDTQDVISAERKASWLNEYGAGGAAKAATYTRALGDLRPDPAAGDALTDAARDVLAERQRQISVEGWTPAHDDQYTLGQLASAAGCYAMFTQAYPPGDPVDFWPWARTWWKPSAGPRRNLVKAGALILAEIERLDRAAIAVQRQGDA